MLRCSVICLFVFFSLFSDVFSMKIFLSYIRLYLRPLFFPDTAILPDIASSYKILYSSPDIRRPAAVGCKVLSLADSFTAPILSKYASSLSLWIKHVKSHIPQNFHIRSFFRLIPKHCKHLAAAAMIISLPVSAKGSAKHIPIYIYRLLSLFSFTPRIMTPP